MVTFALYHGLPRFFCKGGNSQNWEPPDVGLAPTGVWRVPSHPPLQLEDPSLKPKPFPPRPLPSSSPHPPWLFLQCSGSPARGVPIWCGGRGPGGGGGTLQTLVGARPTSGGTRQYRGPRLGTEKVPQRNCVTKILSNIRVNFLVRFCLKTLVLLGNDR